MRKLHLHKIDYLSGALIFVLLGSLVFFGCSNLSSFVKANAGEDAEVLIGDTVSLDGLASTGVKTAQWRFLSKPDSSEALLSDANQLNPSFLADVEGTYKIQLSLNSGQSTDTVTVSAKHVIANITNGSGSSITTRERFNSSEYVVDLSRTGAVLSGETSRGEISSYTWSQISGPSAEFVSGLSSTTVQFTAPALKDLLNSSDAFKWQPLPVSRDDTRLLIKLVVADGSGHSDAATFILYLADAGEEIMESSGLPNVGIDTVVYLAGPFESMAENPLSDWSWTISASPSGSSAVFADTGTNGSSLQVPKFKPDKEGIYEIDYSSTTDSISGTIYLNVAKYSGVGTIAGSSAQIPQCGTCHDGNLEEDNVTPWSGTNHASVFENSMDTYKGLSPEPYLWRYHTVGYNKNASNGGFDDLVDKVGFEYPSSGLTYAAFASVYPELAALSGVQCENCHGPGSQHAGDPLRIAHSYSQFGICGQCHIQESQWINSGHNSKRVGYGAYWLGPSCARCHSSKGFAQYAEGGHDEVTDVSDETQAFIGITCAACHDPHDATNDHQLRLQGEITLIADGSKVDAGKAAVCYMCHDGFYTAFEPTDCDKDLDGTGESECLSIDDQAVYYSRGVHRGTQGPILEGKIALTDLDGEGGSDPDAIITLTENSFHSTKYFTLADVTGNDSLPSTNDKCVTCHMSSVPSSEEEGYKKLGGHAMAMEDDGGNKLVSSCKPCHVSVTDSFNRLARADYDGDGKREGIQDEIKGLLLAVSTRALALDAALLSDPNQLKDGTTESAGVITVDELGYNDFTLANEILKRVVWNHNVIVRDYSLGIHNAAFAIQVLQKTYTAMSALLGSDPLDKSFAEDYPQATLR